MAFNYPFQTLKVVQLRHLTARDNTIARKAFIDCLGMLQEVLLDISSSSIKPSVENSDVAAAVIDEVLSRFPPLIYVPQSAYDTTSEATKAAQMDEMRQLLVSVIRKNKETALDLRSEYRSPSGPPHGAKTTAEAAGFIETFLTTLADQYENLRYPNTAAIPA